MRRVKRLPSLPNSPSPDPYRRLSKKERESIAYREWADASEAAMVSGLLGALEETEAKLKIAVKALEDIEAWVQEYAHEVTDTEAVLAGIDKDVSMVLRELRRSR